MRAATPRRPCRNLVRSGTERETAETIIAALERYGAIIVERSAAPTMYAQRNANWTDILPLNLLQDIPLSKLGPDRRPVRGLAHRGRHRRLPDRRNASGLAVDVSATPTDGAEGFADLCDGPIDLVDTSRRMPTRY